MTWETKIMVTGTLERMRQELKTIFLEGQTYCSVGNSVMTGLAKTSLGASG